MIDTSDDTDSDTDIGIDYNTKILTSKNIYNNILIDKIISAYNDLSLPTILYFHSIFWRDISLISYN